MKNDISNPTTLGRPIQISCYTTSTSSHSGIQRSPGQPPGLTYGHFSDIGILHALTSVITGYCWGINYGIYDGSYP